MRAWFTSDMDMMMSSKWNIFRVTDHMCQELTRYRLISRTKANDAELWSFLFNLRLNKRLSKQSKGWWFETPSRWLWRHCIGTVQDEGRTHNNEILKPSLDNAVYKILRTIKRYRKISNIRRIKSTNLNVRRLVLQLALPNPMKPGVKSRMKM